MNKNNKGFTLVELLITITLMLTILATAIISFITISDRKKDEAYNAVKSQVQTAAEQYFSSNAYYLETLGSGGSALISVGELVDSDYLNVVKDPRTNESLNECYYVKVTKDTKTGKYKYEYYSDEENCSVNSYIKVQETSSIAINLDVVSQRDPIRINGNDWYGERPTIKITAQDSKNSEITIRVKGNEKGLFTYRNSENKYEAKDSTSYSKTTQNGGKQVCYIAENESGKTATQCITLAVDIDNPTCKFTINGATNGSNKYFASSLYSVNLKVSYQDLGSGISTKEVTVPQGGDPKSGKELSYKQYHVEGKRVWTATVEDKVGNKGSCNVEFETETIIGTIIDDLKKIEITGTSCSNTSGESTTWTNGDRTITQEFLTKTYKGSLLTPASTTINNVSKKFTTTTRTAIISLNGTLCNVDVYVDKTKPYAAGSNFPNGKVHFRQWQSDGTIIIDTYIPVEGSGSSYTTYPCLKDKKGWFEIDGYTISANDEHSGIDANSFYRSRVYYDRYGNKTKPGCLKSQSPCTMYDEWYVYDNAGNLSDNIGVLKIIAGYAAKGECTLQ